MRRSPAASKRSWSGSRRDRDHLASIPALAPRFSGHADAGLTETGIVLEQLRDHGLARASQDGVSIPLHPPSGPSSWVVLPQLLRGPAEGAGYSLQPARTQPRTLQALQDALSRGALPTAGHVVAADLKQVTLFQPARAGVVHG